MEQREATGAVEKERGSALEGGVVPRPVRTIHIDDPSRGIETKIIVFFVEPDFAAQVYRRKDVDAPWAPVWTTKYTDEFDAEHRARVWHRENPTVMEMR